MTLALSLAGLLTVALAAVASAQVDDQPRRVFFPNPARAWDHMPTVVIAGAADDPRVPLVWQSIDFWNLQLETLGSPFRFGSVVQTPDQVPPGYLQQRSAAILGEGPVPDVPASVIGMPGDIVVALSDVDFISFSAGFGPPAEEHFFPIADEEGDVLLRLYPPGWVPAPPSPN